MEEKHTKLMEYLNRIIDSRILAVTADNRLANEGIPLLTVYVKNGYKVDDINKINTSLVEGFPAQIEFKPSWFGVPTHGSTLIYFGEGRDAILGKDSKICIKPLRGLQNQQIEAVFDNIEINGGGNMLRKYARQHQPDVAFSSKYTNVVIEVYRISRHEYAFGFHGSVYADSISGGRVQLEYGCSRVEEVSIEELRDSDSYQRNLPQTGQTLPPN